MTGIFFAKTKASFAWSLLMALLIGLLTSSSIAQDEASEEQRNAIIERMAAIASGTEDAPEEDEDEDTDSESSNGVELSETVSVSDASGGTLTLSYPSGWSASPVDGAGIVSLTGDDFEIVSVTFMSPNIASSLGDDPTEVLELLTSSFSDVAGADVSEITELTIGDYPAARVSIDLSSFETLYYAVSIDDGYGFVFGSGVDETVMEAIAASISYEE
jgi:hypothetical protein